VITDFVPKIFIPISPRSQIISVINQSSLAVNISCLRLINPDIDLAKMLYA